MKKALEILGYDPCYHMNEVVRNGHVNFWLKVANKQPYDFDEAFASNGKVFTAGVDVPSSLYWKEQLARYPNAKVLLTIRDPEKWYKSCYDTVFQTIPGNARCNWPKQLACWVIGFGRMNYELFTRDFFHFDYSKENCIKCYNEHNAKVIRECPKEKLLVYEVGEGWEPLCTFLNKPIPSVPFPHVNDTKEMQEKINGINVIGCVLMGVIALPFIGLAWYVGRDGKVAAEWTRVIRSAVKL